MNLLTKLGLDSDIDIRFYPPNVWQHYFTKHKGGEVHFGPNEKYHEPGGYDWLEILEENLFDRFARLKPLANEIAKRGNKVEFNETFCQFSVKFLNINEATLFRMKV